MPKLKKKAIKLIAPTEENFKKFAKPHFVKGEHFLDRFVIQWRCNACNQLSKIGYRHQDKYEAIANYFGSHKLKGRCPGGR